MSCEHCRQAIYSHSENIKKLDVNDERQSYLLQCDLCKAYFEYSPMVNEIPEVAIEHVKQFYPNVLN